MKRTLSIRARDCILEVDDFDDWLDALAEVELARIKIEIAGYAGLDWPFDVSSGITFPSSVRLKERIVCALLLKYPKGLSKTDLQTATGAKPDSLATYLTSKEKGIADGLEKQDDEYLIRTGWLVSAVAVANEVILKSGTKPSGNPQPKDSDIE